MPCKPAFSCRSCDPPRRLPAHSAPHTRVDWASPSPLGWRRRPAGSAVDRTRTWSIPSRLHLAPPRVANVADRGSTPHLSLGSGQGRRGRCQTVQNRPRRRGSPKGMGACGLGRRSRLGRKSHFSMKADAAAQPTIPFTDQWGKVSIQQRTDNGFTCETESTPNA